MSSPISPTEAADALRQVEASRAAIRAAIRTRRGYQHLWLWGAIWVVAALCGQYRPALAARGWIWLDLAGCIGSVLIARIGSRHVRTAWDRRFLAVLAAIILFGFVWPAVLSGPRSGQAAFAYTALVAMQAYVVAGIWFDTHLLWVGLVTAVLLLAGFLFLYPYFWLWAAVFGGGVLIGSGFYIRSSWR